MLKVPASRANSLLPLMSTRPEKSPRVICAMPAFRMSMGLVKNLDTNRLSTATAAATSTSQMTISV